MTFRDCAMCGKPGADLMPSKGDFVHESCQKQYDKEYSDHIDKTAAANYEEQGDQYDYGMQSPPEEPDARQSHWPHVPFATRQCPYGRKRCTEHNPCTPCLNALIIRSVY